MSTTSRRTWEAYEILIAALGVCNLPVYADIAKDPADDTFEGTIEIDEGNVTIDIEAAKIVRKTIGGERTFDGHKYHVSKAVLSYGNRWEPDDVDLSDVETLENPVDAVKRAVRVLIEDRIDGAMECWEPPKYVIRARCPECGMFDAGMLLDGTTPACSHERHEHPLFWSSTHGWVHANGADVFGSYEHATLELPTPGPDDGAAFRQASWVNAESSDWNDHIDIPEPY